MARKRTIGSVVLRLLKEGVITTTDLFVNIALEPFRHSYKGSGAPLRGVIFSTREIIETIKEERKEKQRFYNLLLSLKRDGLISLDSSSKKGTWILSKKGINELEELEKEPKQRYPKDTSKEVIVISYDIPEKYRLHRDWLRGILKFLDFKLLHQSVWIGKTKIPETLLSDIRDREITPFIQIFTISKEGSLSRVI